MKNFYWLTKEKYDGWWGLVALSIFIIFLIWKAVIESWHLLFYVACIVIWIIIYFIFNRVQKKTKNKPASLWKLYSKKYPIIIQYAPPKWINPAEAWLLYNRSVEPTDLTSLIYQRKFEHLIDIETFIWKNSNKEYVKLIKKNDIPITRPLFESEIFDSIFSMGNVKIIEWAFQLRYALMLEDLEFHWEQKWRICRKEKWSKGINLSNNKFSESIFMAWLYLFAMLTSFISDLIEESMDFTLVIRFIILFLIFIIWIAVLFWEIDGRWTLKFTDKWANLASQVIGYSLFIKSCDENKIKFLLKEDPLFIDRTLPYATAFGMETEFLKKISPLKKDWNAKYVRWNKIPVWASVLRFFIKKDDDSLL